MLGTITKTIGKSVTIHTYTAPPAGTEVTTQLVELDDQILVVDTQYAIPFAAEAANYARTLGKPISRVYVTHAHPDHFFGSAEFGAPVYALQSVADEIAAAGESMRLGNKQLAGDVIPDELTFPTRTVSPGTETISGVAFDFREIAPAEAETTLVIGLPDESILIAQDIAYNNMHLFIAAGHLAEWDQAAKSLIDEGFTTILPGHGLPGGPEVLTFVRTYLEVAQPLLASATDGAALKKALVEAFPEAEGTMLLDIQNGYLFPAN